MKRTSWAAVLCGVLAYAMGAQAGALPSSVAPGSIERAFGTKTAPAPSNAVSVPPPGMQDAPANGGEIRFRLTGIAINGATAISPSVFRPLYERLVGREISVADLFAVANAITAAYTRRGYALSFAFVPKQAIENGRVLIEVVEGYVAQYRFAGDPPPPVLKAFARRIVASRPLTTAALERFLLLANDVPGYTVKSVFERIGDAPRGATRLVLQVRHQPLSAQASIDNRGSRALGPWRGRFGVHLDGALGYGESIGLSAAMSSDLRELRYGAADLSWPLGGNGTRLIVDASYSDSKPSLPLLSAVAFAADGITARIGIRHPLFRGRAGALDGEFFVGVQRLKSSLAELPNSQDNLYLVSAGGTYWRFDGSGVTTLDIHLNQGLGLFDATTTASALRSRTAGSAIFTTLEVAAARQQTLGGGFELWGTAFGQIASRGLLSSRQCGYGGAAYGRGFDDSEIAGDNCAMAAAELRYGVNGVPVFQPIQIYVFGDTGYVLRRGALLPQETRSDTAYSAGVGVRWRLGSHLSGWVEYAQPLSRDVALEGNRHGRLFAALSGEL